MSEEPTDKEIQHLAEVIAQAKLSGISAGSWTLARMILTAGYRCVDLAEGHVIEVRASGWTIMHPLACRPRLFDCEVNRAAERDLAEAPAGLGRFRCDAATGRFAIGARLEAGAP
jgi:hypothetical protein